MTAMPPLRDILNNTPATAVDVDYNFGVIEGHVGSELVNRDGSVAMTGPLSLSGPPTAPQQAATKAYVDSNVIPIGTIWIFSGPTTPTGWVFCDGSSKSTTDPLYAALFGVIGYAYGGSGTNFNLPNMQGRFPVGRSIVAPIDATFDTLNDKGGSKDHSIVLPHQHTVPPMSQNIGTHQHYAAHRHPIGNHTHPVPFRKGYSVNSGNQPGNTNAVFVPGNSPAVAFIARNTAIWTGDPEGGPDTGSGSGGPGSSDWDDMAGNSHYVDANGAHTVSLGNVATTGGPTDSGVGANLPPFITLNFIVRIG